MIVFFIFACHDHESCECEKFSTYGRWSFFHGWHEKTLSFHLSPGKVERMMQTIANATRAAMHGVDKRLWCFFVEYFSFLHSNLRRASYPDKIWDGLSPAEILRIWKNRDTRPDLKAEAEKQRKCPNNWERNARRFGCLAFVKIPTPGGKLEPRARPAIFLGYSSKNSAWRFGVWKFKYGSWKFVDNIERYEHQ